MTKIKLTSKALSILFALCATSVFANEAQLQFDFLSKLQGDWRLSSAEKQEGKATYHEAVKPLIGTGKVAMSFKLIGKKSTLQENLLPGTKKEMATMYHCDKTGACDQVLATHYCAMKNQPALIASPEITGNAIVLECDMNTALCKSAEGHVHKITHELSENGEHLKTTYTVFKGGTFKKNSTYHFDRVK